MLLQAIDKEPRILSEAYGYCQRIAREHYENFPVLSLLIPRRLRRHVAAVYAFARAADDFADEGAIDAATRLGNLGRWSAQLDAALEGRPEGPVFTALEHTIRSFSIPPDYFRALIDAFRQDVVRQEYDRFEEVLAYCRRSANPVGAIMLALFGCLNPETLKPSDALCTGLQLANFWQDISVDAQLPRCYIPRVDLERFGVRKEDLATGKADSAMRSLIEFEVQRTKEYFVSARHLLPLVPWRLRMNLRAIRSGGMAILRRIEAIQYEVTVQRPVLSKRQSLTVLLSAVLPFERND